MDATTSRQLRAYAATAFIACLLTSPIQTMAASSEKQESRQGIQPAAVMLDAPDPVHDTIEAQLAAIDQRDADLIWSYATEKFHNKHKNAASFLNQIRLKYRPLYNHRTVTFLEGHGDDSTRIQKIRVEDRYGTTPIIAIYRLEKQPDGKWLIDSLSILLDTDAKPI